MLKSYTGDFNKLGTAEKFLIQLTNLSKYVFLTFHPKLCFCFKQFENEYIFSIFSYKLRIESMLLKEEFASNMGYLEPSIESMIIAAQGQLLLHIYIIASVLLFKQY